MHSRIELRRYWFIECLSNIAFNRHIKSDTAAIKCFKTAINKINPTIAASHDNSFPTDIITVEYLSENNKSKQIV